MGPKTPPTVLGWAWGSKEYLGHDEKCGFILAQETFKFSGTLNIVWRTKFEGNVLRIRCSILNKKCGLGHEKKERKEGMYDFRLYLDHRQTRLRDRLFPEEIGNTRREMGGGWVQKDALDHSCRKQDWDAVPCLLVIEYLPWLLILTLQRRQRSASSAGFRYTALCQRWFLQQPMSVWRATLSRIVKPYRKA